MITKRFSIEGLHCANCALRAEKVLNKQPGVAAAVCNFASAEVQIKYDPKATNVEQFGGGHRSGRLPPYHHSTKRS